MNIEQIKYQIDNAPHGAKSRIVLDICSIEGISKYALYRRLRKKYGPTKIVTGKKVIDEKLIDLVAEVKVAGEAIGLHKRELSTEDAIDVLMQRGVNGADNLSVSTVNRRLKLKGYRVRDKIVRVEAERPNQTHQIDFSRSEYFQVFDYDKSKEDFLLKVSKTTLNYKNKEKHKTLRTWLVGLTDTYSRSTLAMAFAASGESVAVGTEFLRFAYNREEDEHPLRYVPETIKTDNGSFGKSHEFQNFCKSLGVKHELTEANKSRGNQKIEAKWRLIWQKFELKLAVQLGEGAVITLVDYNELLHEKMVEFMQRKHPVRSGSIQHVYKSSLVKYPPRVLNINAAEIMHKVLYRTVTQACQVTIDNELFDVPLFALDQKIRIYKNANNDFMGELIEQWHEPFLLKSTKGYVSEGDYSHRAPATYKEQLENRQKAERKEELANNKIKYMPVVAAEITPDTPFHNEHIEFVGEYEANQFLGKELRKEGLDIANYIDELHEIYLAVGEDYLSKETLLNLVKNYKRQVVNH